MRALPIVSTLVLTLAALAACSAQPEGTPPHGGNGGSTGSGAGAPGSGGATAAGAGAPAAGAGAPSNGFGGASPGGAGAPSNTFGGATAAGGATGSAGGGPAPALCVTSAVGTGTNGLIDDFEHAASPNITAVDGRAGEWWVSVGPTGTVTSPAGITSAGGGALPVTGGMGGGMALHLAGSDSMPTANTGWGADVAVALTPTTAGACYDASAYKGGLKLSLMGTGSVYVSLITIEDKAAPSGTSGNQRVMVDLPATWTDTTITWDKFITGWGTAIPLDPKAIVAVDIAPAVNSVAKFDIWVDNVAFVP